MKKRKIDPLEEIMSNPYYQLRDDYNYAEKVKGTISFGQYSMKYWALERDIVLDDTKNEITEETFVKAIMDTRQLTLYRKPIRELPSFGQNGASCIGF